jgi:hypothetical protein
MQECIKRCDKVLYLAAGVRGMTGYAVTCIQQGSLAETTSQHWQGLSFMGIWTHHQGRRGHMIRSCYGC